MVDDFSTLAEVIGINSAASLIFNDSDAAKETLTALKVEPHVCSACIYNKDGELFAEYFGEGMHGHSALCQSGEPLQINVFEIGTFGYLFRAGHLDVCKKIILDNETIGMVFIRSDLQAFYFRVKLYAGIVSVVMLVSTFVAYLVSVMLRRVISDPILNLAQKMKNISDEKNYSIRVVKSSSDEVGVLIDGFNEMLVQIQDRDSKLEQYSQHLEDQVSLRTCELSKANEELKEEMEERSRTSKALRVSEEKFRSLVDLTSDWIWEIDRNGVFTYAAPSINDFLGYGVDDVLGKTLMSFMPEEEQIRVPLFVKDCVEKKAEIVRFENIQIHKDGRRLVIETSGIPMLDSGGNLLGWRGIDTDITERKEFEETLKQARKDSEDANKAKSEFLANMSHEIRTPMNGIIGMLQVLNDTQLDSEQVDALDVIKKSSNALLSLINDILDISKIEAGKLEMETIPFNLRITVEDVCETIAMRIIENPVETVCLIDSEVPVFLKGDPGRLRQILINLMGNSVKFTDEGDVTLRVYVEHEGKENVLLRFEVSDTGIGIPEDSIQKIFAAFSQADGSITRKYGGTGLGLAISKQFVLMMDGEISVDSKEGEGSIFRFTARFLIDEEAGTRDAEPDLKSDISGTRVLVIDDNKVNQLVCNMMLESLGCRTTVADSGLAGLEVLRKAAGEGDSFGLVLVDNIMPGMSGEETAEAIKADPLIKDVTIVMQTSLGSRGDVNRLQKIGVKGYLVKPVKQDQFQKAVFSALVHTDEGQGVSAQMITRHSIAEADYDDIIILLVEDQLLNQKVATKLLQKKGFKVIIAENGKKAVDALNLAHFDLVLMDIQMPVMDGFMATKEIRRIEQETGGHIPIIAMTANAMKGDRENYLAAGMDDFVPKPIIAEDLYETLARWINTIKGASVESEVVRAQIDDSDTKSVEFESSSEEDFDLSLLLAKFGEDKDFFHELAEIFIKDTPARMNELNCSLKNNAFEDVVQLAHKLKGTCGNFGITALYNLFSEIQDLGKDKSLDEAASIFSDATSLYAQVEVALKKSIEGTLS